MLTGTAAKGELLSSCSSLPPLYPRVISLLWDVTTQNTSSSLSVTMWLKGREREWWGLEEAK
jgi:hypothetical protein